MGLVLAKGGTLDARICGCVFCKARPNETPDVFTECSTGKCANGISAFGGEAVLGRAGHRRRTAPLLRRRHNRASGAHHPIRSRFRRRRLRAQSLHVSQVPVTPVIATELLYSRHRAAATPSIRGAAWRLSAGAQVRKVSEALLRVDAWSSEPPAAQVNASA